MYFTYDGVSIFYKRHTGPGTPIVLLHGWGGSTVSFYGVFEYLSGLNRDVISVDFPGFGSSELPKESWGVEDYADCIEALIKALGLSKVALVGHSFGGRVSLSLGDREWVDRIVLIDSAGLKQRFSIKRQIKIMRYKSAKKAGKDVSSFGSDDYKQLPDEMKPVFVRVVNTFFDKKLKDIKCPVLIFWGRHDRVTPPYMARRFKRGIKGSILVYLNGGHFAYAESSIKFNMLLAEFTMGGN